MRIYDPRIAKFLSVDSITKNYPELTPYQFASNTPIQAIDLDGLESFYINYKDALYLGNLTKPNKEKMSQKEIEVWGNAMNQGQSKGFALGFGVSLDMYTGGRISSSIYASQLFSAFNHNKATTVEGRNQQEKDSRKALSEAAFTYATSLTFGKIFGAVANTFGRKTYDPSLLTFSEGEVTNVYYNNKNIGGYTSNEADGVTLGLNIPSELQGRGLGAAIFKKAINEEFASKFTGIWVKSGMYETGASVNLERYLEAAKKMSPEAAAFQTMVWSAGKGTRTH